ncbi:MAG: hypothetical protein A3G25_00805 [Betaproteobacteria bacterium RIFCSPLOWO2_12_FULL_63_13]|nr:MAG: hypothetical protein A3H32_15625 [Betaproteobacteria bacterium RIFCSPLOWO2_02_FULL_63_19]OGA48766.1 MAG: hypothetical protein A3G25_00805 [Betaproteobacteria bacterium RIFCSPLOWO2_12_FULL_63_13]
MHVIQRIHRHCCSFFAATSGNNHPRLARLLACLAIAGCALASAPGARAQSTQLKYAIAGNSTCAHTSSTGFTASPGLAVVSTTAPSVRTSYISGTLILSQSGTGTYDVKIIQMYTEGTNLAGGKSPLNESTTTCSVVYQAQSDGTYNFELLNCQATLLAGNVVGTSTPNGISMKGVFSPGGLILQLTDVATNVETGTSNTSSGTGSYARICARDIRGIRIP